MRGKVVLLVGPDGSGKTTVANELAAASGGVRLHGWGPVLRPGVARTHSTPHEASPYGPALSLAKLLHLYTRASLFWLLRVRPARRRGGLVIVERGWLDLVVDPRRYRLGLAPVLPRALGRLLPRPDLVAVLEADPETIVARKSELGAAEVERQLTAWRAVAGRRAVIVDAAAAPAAVAAAVLRALDGPEAEAPLALRCVGASSASGARYSLVTRDGRPRWLLPGRRGPLRSGLYRPVRPRQALAAAAFEAAFATGAVSTPLMVDPATGLAPALAEALGLGRVELAVSTARKAGGERVVAAVRARGELVAFAKVGDVNPGGLALERAVLEALERARPHALRVPRVLAWLEWEGERVLVLEPVAARGRADRALGRPEHDALAELGSLGEALEPVLGSASGRIPVHGDFAPWNSARLRGGALALWDWEETRLGLPLEDLFHWRTQRIVHLGAGTPADLVASAAHPDAGLRALCAALGVDPGFASVALRAYLERGLADPRLAQKHEPALPIRREALALLGEAA